MYSTKNKRDPTNARKAQDVHFMPILRASCSIHRKHCGSIMIRLWAIDRSASLEIPPKLLFSADEVIEQGCNFAAVHESAVGTFETCRPHDECRFLGVKRKHASQLGQLPPCVGSYPREVARYDLGVRRSTLSMQR